MLNLYMELEKLRFGDEFSFSISSSDTIQEDDTFVHPMIIQPFIENAIEHGRLHLKEDGFINVHFYKEGSMLHITVIDNGIGRKGAEMNKKSKEHKSMAMKITKDRIDNLNKKYRSDGYMQIEDYDKEAQTGTKVLISIPYRVENQIKMVIDKVLALASEQGVGGAPVEKIEPEEEEAIAALDAGDYAKAEAAYKKLLARKPNDNFAILGLAQTQLMARTDGIDGAKIMQEAIESPTDIEIQLRCADIEIVSGYLEPAFARLLRLIPLFDGADKKIVKDRLIELFALVDPADPRVIKARAALANALF